MAENDISAYFPPLDRCLTGDAHLISWKTAYRALCDLDAAVDNTELEAFLTHAETDFFLCHPLDPFLQRGEKTKADYNTKTAPIHVSQSSSEQYDVEQLKQDALWLSEKAEVEELVALRVVILESQQRAQDQLMLATSQNGGAAVAVQPNLGASFLGASTANLAASIHGASTPTIDLGTHEIRRHRQLQIYLDEKSHVLKISTELANCIAAKALPQSTCKWIQNLAGRITRSLCPPHDPVENEAFCGRLIDKLDSWLDALFDPSKQSQAFKDDPSNVLMLEAATFEDITTALRLVLANELVLDSSTGHSHAVVSSWFKLMAKMNFFQKVVPSPALPNIEPLQSLVSIVSVSMLNLTGAITQLQESYQATAGGSVQYPQLNEHAPYYTNEACFKDINLILYNAAQEQILVASPAIYAWSTIATYVQNIASQIREQREQQHEESSDGELVSRRRASRRDSRDDMSIFEKLYTHLQDFELEAEARENPATFFARVSVETTFSLIPRLSEVVSSAFGSGIEAPTCLSSRAILLDLVRHSMVLLTYGAEVIEAVLSLLSPDVYSRFEKLDTSLVDDSFYHERDFGPALLNEALSRYPYEFTPYLRLLTVLAQSTSSNKAGPIWLVEKLENTRSLTVMVTEDFRDYALEHEEEHVNSIVLKEDIPLFATKQEIAYGTVGQRSITMGSEGKARSNILAIPAGTPGVVVKESRPLVFRLEHSHSALEYLGLLLSTIRANSEYVTVPFEHVVDLEAAADTVSLLTALLKASLKQHQGIEEARFILARFGNSLPQGQDITSVIADIFETELLSHLDQSIRPSSLELLISCAELLIVLTTISPERVWSILSRSSLLGLASGATALAAVVAGTEVQLGRFKFLGSCATLFSSLIDNAIAGLIKRKAKVNKSSNRFDSPMSYQDTTPERTMTAVITAYEAVMIDAWQSMGEWRFVVPMEKAEITKNMLLVFERLLRCTYGAGNSPSDDHESEEKISALLQPAATPLLDAFTGSSANGSALRSLETVFSAGYVLADENLTVDERRSVLSEINAANQLLTAVLRTHRACDDDGEHIESLRGQVIYFTPYLAFIQAADHSIKRSTATVLSEIVQTFNQSTDSDPPSLLSQLTTEAGKNFLAVVTQFDQPLNDLPTECAIWDLLSTVMSNRQLWFAIYLLTGALPKDRLQSHTAAKGKSLLAHALDRLSKIRDVSPDLAMAMLKFVAFAQSVWVWATNEVRSHSEFLTNTLVWLHSLSPPTRANEAEEVLGAQEHQIAAYLCDILAVNLHASREIGDTTVFQSLIPKLKPVVYSRLGFLSQHGAAVDAYNRSLHKNLAENFARKFRGSQIADFARTKANPASFGRDYFYDKDLADRILGHDAAWNGLGSNAKQHGFAHEFARANVNLSLVDAQRSLLKSWRVLATILSESIAGEPKLPDEMVQKLREDLAHTAQRCLQANSTANLDVPGMDEIVNIRADLAFVIISKLVAAKVESYDMKSLLPSAWDLVRSAPVDYDIATAAEDLQYYRTLLQILYLAIQPYVYMKPERPGDSSPPPLASPQRPSPTDEIVLDYLNPEIAAILVEILAKTIAPGFRALCGNLHNSIDLATPADFALLTAILRAILSVRGIDSVHPQITNVITSTSLIRGALSLYSWSDQLAEVMAQDPVYGEVAALFLLALSTVRSLADSMAVEGVLVQLSSANLSNYFRKVGGKGPFSEPRRMFSIWIEAFLPLCLNLLDAVGPAITADVAGFLNEFPEQLHRAETSLENVAPSLRNPHAGAVTLGLVSEAHSLCIVGLVLESDTLRGAADGIDPTDVPKLAFDYRKVKDDAAGLMRQRTSLQSRVVAVGEREEAWKATDVGAASENLLMGKVTNEIKALMGTFGES